MRKLKIRSLSVVLIAVLLLLLVGCGTSSDVQKSADSGKVYKLRVTSVLAEGAAQSKGLKAWANELEKRTNGQVKIEQMTWSGALLKPDNILEGLRDHVVDVAFISQAYNPTKTPLTAALQPVFWNDFSGSTVVQMEFFNTVPEIKEEWLKWKTVPVAWLPGADQVLMTNFKFDSVDALKGKKLRAIGSSLPIFVKNLGGIPVNISAADTYSALEKGTVDGVTGFPAYALVSNKMAEISKQITDFRYGGNALWFGIMINKEVYDQFPDSIKKTINDIAPFAAEAAAEADKADAMAGFKLARQQGQRLVQLTPEEAAKWKEAINPRAVWEENLKVAEAAGYKDARSLLDKMVKMMDEYDAKHPHKTLMEQFLEQEKAGK